MMRGPYSFDKDALCITLCVYEFVEKDGDQGLWAQSSRGALGLRDTIFLWGFKGPRVSLGVSWHL